MEYNYSYGNGRPQRRPPQKNNQDDWLSWVLIALLLFGGGWFIALPWLFIKLFGPDKQQTAQSASPSLGTVRRTSPSVQAQRKSVDSEAAAEKVRSAVSNFTESPKSSKAYIALIIAGAAVALFGLLMMFGVSTPYQFLSVLAWTVGGAGMVAGGINIKNAESRYKRYKAVIGSNPAIHIATLAKKMGYKEKRVRKDLQKMLEKGYFGPEAYINDELGYLFASSEADAELIKARNAAMQKVEEAARKEESTQEVNYYSSIISQIRDVNDRIPQPEMTAKIYRLEEITRQIFHAVEEDPEKRSKINRFLSYYLPTTLKLLESYAKLDRIGIEGDNIAASKKTIEDSMDSIVAGFENQLDQLYKNDVLDIESDVGAMTKMLNREGSSAASDFGIDFSKKDDIPTLTLDSKKQTSSGEVSFGGSAAQTK